MTEDNRVKYQQDKITYHKGRLVQATQQGNLQKADYHASKIKYAEDKLAYLGVEV